MKQLLCTTVFVLALSVSVLSSCSKKDSVDSEEPLAEEPLAAKPSYTLIEWTDLLPDDDLEAIENPPEYLADIQDGSEGDQLVSQLKAPALNEGASANNNQTTNERSLAEDRYQQALASTNIRPEFNERDIRIPGFIVPLEFDDHQTITTFFFVPFFGACIHMPPPPPNQIIYAEYEPGIRLDALYDPFWISGTVFTSLVENDMATAAYSMTVTSIEPYYIDIIPQVPEQGLDDTPPM